MITLQERSVRSNAMNLLQHFKELTVHPKNARELKSLILELAIRGKLTENWRKENPNVEPASTLFKKIEEEKAQLIKEKKIKKEKFLPEVEEDQIPFELPESWIWSRLRNLVTLLGDGIHGTPNYTLNGAVHFVNGNNLSDGLIEIKHTTKTVSEEEAKKHHRELNNRTVLVSINGTIGNTALYNGEKIMLGKSACYFNLFERVDKEYIRRIITSKYFINYAFSSATGTTIKNVSLRTMREFILPLPPLEEQKAIVNIVDQLFKEVEQLEEQTKARSQLKEDYVKSALRQLSESNTKNSWQNLMPHFKTFFTEKSAVKQLRETILQLAVQGKLTKKWRISNPDVEPASVLLQKIKTEKEQLVKAKKIKKEKPLPPITKEEIPYELPKGWEWCRMQEVGLFERGKSKHRPRNDYRLFQNGKYPLVQTGDVSNAKTNGGIIRTHKSAYNDFGLAQSRMWPKETLCITIAANIAETGILGFDACFPDSVVGFSRLSEGKSISNYVQYFITVMKSNLEKFAPSTAQKNINLGILYELKFPLPPAKEQEEVVEKVNALMAFCDQLEEAIEENTIQIEQLMQSCLKEVFEN